MDRKNSTRPSRRAFLGHAAAGAGLGLSASLVGCKSQPAPGPAAAVKPAAAGSSGPKKLRAAFSNVGLQSTWCKLGKDTAELWGKLLDVEVTWLDGEFSPERQREKIELAADEDFDFCCFQAVQIDTLAEPVRKLKKRGIPVISMDTLIVEPKKMRETGVWMEVMPDQVFMGESSTGYLVDKIGGKGKVIHIGGRSAHSGAQGRKKGFEKVLARHPGVEVVGGGVRWCDWEPEKARDTFEAILSQHTEPLAGAFFHSDDMAMAAIPALAGTPHAEMVVTAVDGQKQGLTAVREGKLAATTVNPVCLIHKQALEIGQFIVRNEEKMESLPLEIITPGPLVSRESGNIDAMVFLSDPRHCMV